MLDEIIQCQSRVHLVVKILCAGVQNLDPLLFILIKITLRDKI